MELQNRVFVVTGSASGIGAACATQLAERGAGVVVNYTRSQAEAEEVAAACEKVSPAGALLCRADVSDDADCRRMAEMALEKWGRIDGLINNAGRTKFADHSDLDALSMADFQSIYAVNVVGAYQMARAVAPAMRDAGYGSIVNISSIAGVMGTGSSIAYAASKGALNTLTLSLARSLAPVIRVNTICPGFVDGRWLKGGLGDRYDKVKENVEKSTPLQRAGQPEDMAEMALALLTASTNTTGQIVLCDAGAHLGPATFRSR